MSIEIKEVVHYAITDCRGLSRAEMLAFITTDVIMEHRLPVGFITTFVTGPWTITCIPEDKGICYEYESEDEYYTAHFWPKRENGIQIDYVYPSGSWSTEWSVDQVMDMLGA